MKMLTRLIPSGEPEGESPPMPFSWLLVAADSPWLWHLEDPSLLPSFCALPLFCPSFSVSYKDTHQWF